MRAAQIKKVMKREERKSNTEVEREVLKRIFEKSEHCWGRMEGLGQVHITGDLLCHTWGF